MITFYKYISPIAFLILSFGLSTFMNNEFIVYIGGIISLVWLNRVATKLNNKALKYTTIILLIATILWTGLLLLYATAW